MLKILTGRSGDFLSKLKSIKELCGTPTIIREENMSTDLNGKCEAGIPLDKTVSPKF